MIHEKLIDRLNSHATRRGVVNVRRGRRDALAIISRYCVVTTDNGRETREVEFAQPPTVGQLIKRVGPDAWVVSVKMQRSALRRHPSHDRRPAVTLHLAQCLTKRRGNSRF